MATASEYRNFAAAQRREANECDSELMRKQYLSSADRWDTLAEEIARCEPPAQRFGFERQQFF